MNKYSFDESEFDDFNGFTALESMRRFGLDPDSDDDVYAYMKAYGENQDRRDPHADRYQRAAQTAATERDQALMAEQAKKMGGGGGDMWFRQLGEQAFHQAKPLPEEQEAVSTYFDEQDGVNLDDLGRVVFKGTPTDPGDEINRLALRRQLAAGVDIYEEDIPPEDMGDPDRYLKSIDRAVAAKLRQKQYNGKPPDLGKLWDEIKSGGLV
jgi:alkanesulfonate monooxygenase SsuD/methylene tetrahydromethanopterin reductase-like flavin-dependent oxidoreductase (luciferase family)